jgi:DNA-binding beta-propeller fold protein YncE
MPNAAPRRKTLRRGAFRLGLITATIAGGVAVAPVHASPAAPQTLLYASIWNGNHVVVADGIGMRELTRFGSAGEGPSTQYATPDHCSIYLENGGYTANTVDVIDAASMRIRRQLSMPGVLGDRGAAIQDDGRYYYWSSIPDLNIARVSVATGAVDRVYPHAGNEFTISKDGRTLFISGLPLLPGALQAVDAETGRPIDRIDVPGSALNPPLGMGYTQISADGTEWIKTGNPVQIVDIRDPSAMKLVAQIPVGSEPVLGAFSPDGRWLWLPNAGDGTISVIDLRSRRVVRTIDTGNFYMTGATFDPSGRFVYVSQARNGAAVPPGPANWPVLNLGVMGFAGLLADHNGYYGPPRPGLDVPGEIVQYDAATFAPTSAPALQTDSVPAFTLAVNPRRC